MPFLITETEDADLTVRYIPVPQLPKVPEGSIFESIGYFTGSSVYYCDHEKDLPYARLTSDLSNNVLTLEYVEGFEKRFATSQNIINHLGLESLLLMHDILLLHCAFIRVDNRGILFSAPSGTGKSTQAELWRKCRNADILNGDRAGLCKCDDQWTACGLPYAGTSGIYRNDSAPIQAVVVLRQAKENAVRRLRPAEAMRYLYPELTLHRWEPVSVNDAMDLLTDLVISVPVFLLECRPDEEAVNVLEQALMEVSE